MALPLPHIRGAVFLCSFNYLVSPPPRILRREVVLKKILLIIYPSHLMWLIKMFSLLL
jgi:hypothetical protein